MRNASHNILLAFILLLAPSKKRETKSEVMNLSNSFLIKPISYYLIKLVNQKFSKLTQLNQSNTQFNTSSRGFGFLGFWGWGLSPTTKRQKDKTPA